MANVRLLHSPGNEELYETTYNLPEPADDEVQIKTGMVGVCRSDIDWYTGNFPDLGLGHFGHEGIGTIVKVGKNTNFCVGWHVSTVKSDPCYADYYNAKASNIVTIPAISPEYILEPVACAINIAQTMMNNIQEPEHGKTPVLLLGSGFLATVIYKYMQGFYATPRYEFYVVGNANRSYWDSTDVNVLDSMADIGCEFSNIIDLSPKPEYFAHECFGDDATVIMAAEKHPEVTTSFSKLLWSSSTVIFPSPRDTSFQRSHKEALKFVMDNRSMMSEFWTKGYNRETEYTDAFIDGLNRQPNYSRGYIVWD